MAVWEVANKMKLSSDRVLWVIEQYAQRKLLSHFTITRLIQTDNWSSLALILYNDATYLDLTIPLSNQSALLNLSTVIKGLKERFFEIDELDDDDDLVAWVGDKRARDRRNQLCSNADSRRKAQDRLIQMM